MKVCNILALLVMGFSANALADSLKPVTLDPVVIKAEKSKATVKVNQSSDAVNITVKPLGDYKWNADYPATLKFSVCNATECVIVTEKITTNSK